MKIHQVIQLQTKLPICTLQDIPVTPKLLNNINVEPLLETGSPKYIHLLPQIVYISICNQSIFFLDLNIKSKDLPTRTAKTKMTSLGHRRIPQWLDAWGARTQTFRGLQKNPNFPPFFWFFYFINRKFTPKTVRKLLLH